MKQQQFLEVVSRDEAERRWQKALSPKPLAAEELPLSEALGRVLATDVRSSVDVPSFDRANMDGFAIRAADSYGAAEEQEKVLALNDERLPTGVAPKLEVKPGTATPIATGGMLPRGADAVVPVEQTEVVGDELVLRAPRVPGAAVSFAGSDIARGETVLFSGTLLSARETGLLAAIGAERVSVIRRPRVAVISTGDEIIAPGQAMRPGMVFDSNGRILCDAVTELGCEPSFLGAYADDEAALRQALTTAIEGYDAVLLSGGTSKGEGDLSYRAVQDLTPGIVVHGVALKPGKPICLAASGHKPVAILPGFPTSAVFTFHELVAPVLRQLGGLPAPERGQLPARLAQSVRSDRGRRQYLLVSLLKDDAGGYSAYPMGGGSGSVTTFSRADGFVTIDEDIEIVDEGSPMAVTLLSARLTPADLVIVGSHCVGLDLIAAALGRKGLRVKILSVGSRGGLLAATRGQCDAAPIHLLDPDSGRYNAPFLTEGLTLLSGYGRMQGVVSRPDEQRPTEALIDDPQLRMVNRNRGSGTRVLIDELLCERRPDGHAYQPSSHHAVAAAIAQGRADWGVTIETVARENGLHFRPLREERYDFVIPEARLERPAVRALGAILEPGSDTRAALERAGFTTPQPAS
ncbi:MAG: molybdopterin biosynthesis protein [Myxococcales bacterium]|nr:molybdopterin biosynthesis protein [Myxococcales bacterium]